MFLGKGFLKICSKFTGEHPYLSVISLKLPCGFIGITLRHKYSPVNLLHIFRTSFLKGIVRSFYQKNRKIFFFVIAVSQAQNFTSALPFYEENE